MQGPIDTETDAAIPGQWRHVLGAEQLDPDPDPDLKRRVASRLDGMDPPVSCECPLGIRKDQYFLGCLESLPGNGDLTQIGDLLCSCRVGCLPRRKLEVGDLLKDDLWQIRWLRFQFGVLR